MVSQLIRRTAAASVAVVGIEAAYAILKPSPDLEEFDPSGNFGNPDHPKMKVAVLGDSSVTAPGVSGPDEIWVSIICENLAAQNRHVELKSLAVGGSMAHDLVADQLEEAILFGPDLIMVSVGANDVLKGVPRRVFARNLDQLISELADTGALVVQSGVGVLGTIPRLYPPLSGLVSARARRFDDVHWRVAKRHGTTVVHQRSDDPSVWHEDDDLWAADDFHVSAAGHVRWAGTVWATVEPLVNGAGGPA